jgi:hypothetical protein
LYDKIFINSALWIQKPPFLTGSFLIVSQSLFTIIASSTKYPFAFMSSPKPIFLRIVYALSLMPIPAPTSPNYEALSNKVYGMLKC